MRRYLLASVLLLAAAGTAAAQDMPLSQVLIDGEGWRNVTKEPHVNRPGAPGVTTKSGHVYHIRPEDRGGIRRATAQEPSVLELVELPGVGNATCLTLSPDEGTLIVGDADSKHLWAYRIEKDGKLTCGEPYYTLRMKPGRKATSVAALITDTAGRVYAATPLGVQVFDPTGRMSGVLTHPEPGRPLIGIAFGGPDRKTLFVATANAVYARKVKVQGAVWTRPPEEKGR